MNRVSLKVGRRLLLGIALGTFALVAPLANPSLARRSLRTAPIQNVLHARRIGHAGFGMTASRVIRSLDRLLKHRPTERIHVVHSCGIDHAIGWPSLVVFLRGHRFVGYSYRPAYASHHVPILATARGLEVGDTLSTGKSLYGRDFHASRHHGGSWWVTTQDGQLEGLASGWPEGPVGSVATIAAGSVGCPGVTP